MPIVNREREPAYAGLQTFCKCPLALTPEDLAGADVAIVGAPFDEGVSNRPGARFGPRAIRQADNLAIAPPARPSLALGVDPFSDLRIVDYGDAECLPAALEQSHREIKARVTEILRAGAIPIILGGDHSVAYPNISAMAEHYGAGRVGVIQFDAHADTAGILWDVKLSHGTPMRLVVDEGSIRGEHFLQFGLRGYWPDPPDFDWMRSVGMRWHLMAEVIERGFETVLADLVEEARELPDVLYLVLDIDVVDPAFAPGTGTPEPGGLTAREFLYAVRTLCSVLPIRGIEVVEVSPPYDSSEITAMTAHRAVLEAVAGIAVKRSGRGARPQRSGAPS
jgi:agmatinase